MLGQRRSASVRRMMVLAIGGCLMVFMLIVWRAYQTNSFGNTPTQANAVDAARTAVVEKDIDHDGLADWEEGLWNTDPKNPDTDGDGVPDGEEVREGRDPIVSGTSGRMLASNMSSTSLATAVPHNATEAVSRDLFGTFMLALRNNRQGDLSPKEQDTMVKDAISAAGPYVRPKVHTMTDLHTVPTSATSLKQYQTQLDAVLKPLAKSGIDESAALFKIAHGNTTDAMETMKHFAEISRTTLDTLLTVDIPTDIAPEFLTFVNSFETYYTIMQGFTVLYTDPVRATVSTSGYLTAHGLFINSLVALHHKIASSSAATTL